MNCKQVQVRVGAAKESEFHQKWKIQVETEISSIRIVFQGRGTSGSTEQTVENLVKLGEYSNSKKPQVLRKNVEIVISGRFEEFLAEAVYVNRNIISPEVSA